MGKLLRLELYNFKSYKGHHVLLFGDAHFTSIIGPNGSGKSNSMDAISFVLGIKSSHLRSTHLRDLIYRGRILKTSKIQADGTATEQGTNGNTHENRDVNGDVGSDQEDGTSATQSQSAQSAWVMAVYEDDAGEEQHWKRTITSAGQSEYRINNRVVGAKQYNEVLEAENILIKARNFLVFQGDVEAIASQSPRDLTRLVEQISGSLELKPEYERLEQEAEKATEDQTFKHNQRRGINAEIKQFTEQKKEADNYNRKADERDDAVVTHVLWKLYHFQRVIEEAEQEIQRHQDELKEHKRGVEKYERRLDEAKKEQAKAGKEVSKSERTLKSTEKQIDEKMHDLVPIDEKVLVSNKNLEKYKKRIADVSKERHSQQQSVQMLKKDLNVVTKAQSKWDQDFKKVAEKEGRQLSNADLQEYNRLRTDVSKRAANAQINVDNLTRQRNTDEETVNNLRSNVEESDKQARKLEANVTDIRERRNDTEGQVKQVSKDIETKKQEFHKITSERLRTAQRQTELDEKLQQVLRKLIEADNGQQQNAKEARTKEIVSRLKRIFPGVHGRMHEICKPKQKKYETAVSTVLGRNFDSVIVETNKIANECIEYIKEQRLGIMTFLPLDTIQAKGIRSDLKGMHKKMRLAVDTIECDHSMERVLSSVCGSAMICDDLNTAKYLCYDKRIDSKAVTLDGTVIHKGGLMTGGRGPSDNNSRRWEDSEVENLRTLKDKLMNEIAGLPKGHKALTDEETLRDELDGLEQRLAFMRDESKALEKNQESKTKEVAFVQKQLKEARPKYQKQAKDLDDLRDEIQEFQDEVNHITDQVFSSFCQRLGYESVREYEAQQGSMQQEAAQKKLEFTTQRSKLDNQVRFEEGRLQSTRDRIKSLEDQSKRDQDLIESLEDEKQIMEGELKDMQSELEQVKETMEGQKREYEERAGKVTEQRREVQRRSKDSQFLQDNITKLEADMQRNNSYRYSLLRKCKIDEVKLPLAQGSVALDSLPVDDVQEKQAISQGVDEDGDTIMGGSQAVKDYGIELDFESLEDELKDVSHVLTHLAIFCSPLTPPQDPSDNQEKSLKSTVETLTAELSNLNPNMRALDRLSTAQTRLKTTESDYTAARRLANETREAFEDIKTQRADLFNKAFGHISDQIDPVYKALTRSANLPLGGQAYLDALGADDDTPFLGGLKYHAMPPLKRFRDMDALSGGEKTIAALALLFAVHSYAPSPFFVLDEVDAALDNANVAKVAKYIREHARPGMQFIVISLKTGLFQESECLVGVLRDQGANSSRAVTLDLRKYQPT